jgi:alpha-L-fucosidase
MVRPGEGLKMWVGPQNAGWIPAEANLHTRSTWFWTPNSDNTLRDIPFLKKVYFESIGRGANLLVNMTPDTTGLIPEAEVERLSDFGKNLDNIFATPLGSTSTKDNKSTDELVLNFAKKQKVNLLVLEEDIENGQHIKSYIVDAYINNQWKTIAEGQSIGRKRIQTFPAIKTSKIRLSLKGEKESILIKNFIVYSYNE